LTLGLTTLELICNHCKTHTARMSDAALQYTTALTY
jgi:hypothetical protein